MIEFCPEHDLILQRQKVDGETIWICPWKKRVSETISRHNNFDSTAEGEIAYRNYLSEKIDLVKEYQEIFTELDYQLEIDDNNKEFTISWIDQSCSYQLQSNQQATLTLPNQTRDVSSNIEVISEPTSTETHCPDCGEKSLYLEELQPNRFNDEQSEQLEYCNNCSYSNRSGR